LHSRSHPKAPCGLVENRGIDDAVGAVTVHGTIGLMAWSALGIQGAIRRFKVLRAISDDKPYRSLARLSLLVCRTDIKILHSQDILACCACNGAGNRWHGPRESTSAAGYPEWAATRSPHPHIPPNNLSKREKLMFPHFKLERVDGAMFITSTILPGVTTLTGGDLLAVLVIGQWSGRKTHKDTDNLSR
jgi:hypothetical protein